MLFDRQPLFESLQRSGSERWAEELRFLCEQRLTVEAHGKMPQWIEAWESLPAMHEGVSLNAKDNVVRVVGAPDRPAEQLQQTLMQFHPWRKGPFEFFGILLDTEWRSELKWRRLSNIVDFQGATVLDVGCGNGYYGWKMLDEGARLVVGCDPYPLYQMQFEVFRRYAAQPERHFLVPLSDHELPNALHAFDITLSMGVLYHRSSPIEHLQTLWQTLAPGGRLILETLIIDENEGEVLVPETRYAKMRNVWFIPSLPMLTRWLRRTGFIEIEIEDVTPTTTAEQRSTEWMTFESLADFLDPLDPNKTIEGYPAPTRAIVSARRA